MKTKLILTALTALVLLGLTSCGSIDSGPTHYVPAMNGKSGVQAVR